MIKVTVELWPYGEESSKRTIASANIYNDGSGSPFLGSYGFALFDEDGKPVRSGGLGEYFRADGIWKLIAAVMRVAEPDVEKSFRDDTIRSRVDEPAKERP